MCQGLDRESLEGEGAFELVYPIVKDLLGYSLEEAA